MAPREQTKNNISLCARSLVAALICWAASASASAMEVKDALAHFESGATSPAKCSADYKIGSRKEVSRFQILPSVWRKYSDSDEFQQPAVAWKVAERILAERQAQFRAATGRECDGVDLYLMWNAPGVYERAHWDRRRVSRVVLDRAQRFANLLALEQEKTLVRASVQ